MKERRKINTNGEELTKLNIEITPTEVEIINYAKKEYNFSKTAFVKRAMQFWYEQDLQK